MSTVYHKRCELCQKAFTTKWSYQVNCSKRCNKNKWNRKNRGAKSFLGKDKGFFDTETGRGFLAEKMIAKAVGGKHLEFNIFGLDIKMPNGELIDVKSAKLNKRKNKRGKPVLGEQKGYWNFKGWGKNEPAFFICVGYDEKDRPTKMLKIPSAEYPKNGICVDHKSKYDKYSM